MALLETRCRQGVGHSMGRIDLQRFAQQPQHLLVAFGGLGESLREGQQGRIISLLFRLGLAPGGFDLGLA
jgi:hypothetical protein